MTQTAILACTLIALALMPVGYWAGYYIGWLTDPRRPRIFVVKVVFDLRSLNKKSDELRRDVEKILAVRA